MKENITRDMTIAEIFEKFPHQSEKLAQVITDAGLHCIGCGGASWETLEAGMLGHGFMPVAVDDLVKKLNAIIAQEIDLTKVTLTVRAAGEFRKIAEEENKKACAIRLSKEGGGCHSEHVLSFSEKAEEGDAIFKSHGVEIHINKAEIEYLLGTEIDYVDGLHESGFKITNPNRHSSCGCGKSKQTPV